MKMGENKQIVSSPTYTRVKSDTYISHGSQISASQGVLAYTQLITKYDAVPSTVGNAITFAASNSAAPPRSSRFGLDAQSGIFLDEEDVAKLGAVLRVISNKNIAYDSDFLAVPRRGNKVVVQTTTNDALLSSRDESHLASALGEDGNAYPSTAPEHQIAPESALLLQTEGRLLSVPINTLSFALIALSVALLIPTIAFKNVLIHPLIGLILLLTGTGFEVMNKLHQRGWDHR